MTLSAGTRLGPYEIQSAIGAGGMGEVYRAHDPRLGRDVAVTPCMTQIYDLSDPAKPVFIRNFGLLGQQAGATGPVPTDLHGPISTGPKGNRVYFGYGTSRGGI